MVDRLISLVLIAAVVACPMWCGSGMCPVGQCCAFEACGQALSPVSCSLHESAECCCCQNSSATQDEDTPCPCRDTSTCQGICGGAVFEKSSEPDGPDFSFFLPMVLNDESLLSVLARSRTAGAEHHHCVSAGNHGRFLRTLQSSFLC